MRRLLDIDLDELTMNLIRISETSEKTVGLSIMGYLEGIDVSDKVFEMSKVVVSMNTDIEDKAFELIAKYQPVASDLRIIKSYMKIGYDLERYSRYAQDISFIHKRIVESEKSTDWEYIQQLTNIVMKMVNVSIQSLRDHDAELAKTLAKTEEQVDQLYFKYLDYISTKDYASKHCVVNLLIVRYLERIADHATYIGESVVYIATGEKLILR
jgi:phosphate transport system protein